MDRTRRKKRQSRKREKTIYPFPKNELSLGNSSEGAKETRKSTTEGMTGRKKKERTEKEEKKERIWIERGGISEC